MSAGVEDIGRRTARSTAGLAIRTIIGQAVGLLGLFVLSDRLDASSYAVYALTILIVGSATAMTTLPIIIVLVRTADAPSRATVNSATTFAALFLGCVGLIGTGAMSLIAAPYVAVGLGGTLYGIFTASTIPSTVVLQRDLRAARASMITLVGQVALQAGMASCIVLGASVTTALVAALVAAGIVSAAWAQYLARWRPSLERLDHVSHLLAPATGAFLIGLVNLLIGGGITLVTAAFLSGTDAGYFAWAYTIAIAAQGLLSLFDTALIPALARSASAARESGYAMATRLAALFSILVNLVVAMAVPALIGPVFPGSWDHALDALFFLCIGNMFAGYSLTAHSLWYVQFSTMSLARRYAGACALAGIAFIPLLPWLGAAGGAVAFLVYQASLAVMLHFGLRSVVRPQVFPVVWIGLAGLSLATRYALDQRSGANAVIDGLLPLVGFVALALLVDRGRVAREVRALVEQLVTKPQGRS